MYLKLNNKIVNLFIFSSIFFGIFIRIYNINYDDFWFDEIVSFWVSDPTISIKESFDRNNIAEGSGFLYNFILKSIYNLFQYDPNIGRYVSSIFSILSIFTLTYLSKLVSKNNSHLLTLFLVSFNVFLILYSMESRLYSFLFFLISLNLIFLFKVIEYDKKNKNFKIYLYLFFFTQIISILTHLFSIIVFFSIAVFCVLNYLLYKKRIKYLNRHLAIIFIFILFYLLYYLYFYPGSINNWIQQPSIKFLTNLYFSKFFGSRAIGLFHLILLIFLIYKFKSKILYKFDKKLILLIILISSYALPLIVGFIKPVILARYIIFVLIPIILLISYLIFELKNMKIRNLIISFIIVINFGNQFFETNIKQFFQERPFYKPQFKLALNEINSSNYKKFSFNLDFVETQKHKKIFNQALTNYTMMLAKKNNLDISTLNIFDTEKIDEEKFWIICMQDIMGERCSNINNEIKQKFQIVEEKYFNSLNLKLIKLNS